jgi:hypothetical protein
LKLQDSRFQHFLKGISRFNISRFNISRFNISRFNISRFNISVRAFQHFRGRIGHFPIGRLGDFPNGGIWGNLVKWGIEGIGGNREIRRIGGISPLGGISPMGGISKFDARCKIQDSRFNLES